MVTVLRSWAHQLWNLWHKQKEFLKELQCRLKVSHEDLLKLLHSFACFRRNSHSVLRKCQVMIPVIPSEADCTFFTRQILRSLTKHSKLLKMQLCIFCWYFNLLSLDFHKIKVINYSFLLSLCTHLHQIITFVLGWKIKHSFNLA